MSAFDAPAIDYAGLSPVLALTGGAVLVLFTALLRGAAQRVLAPALTLATLGTTAGLLVWRWGERADLVAGALRIDELSIALALIAVGAAVFCVLFSLREPAAEQAGPGEYHALLLASVLGMVLLVEARNLIALFVAFELLSIPLYVLCGAAIRRASSLESGLKYLIIGSLGSATLLYGLAFLYGASGSLDLAGIADGLGRGGLGGDALALIGVALCATGLAFKTSIAPFHQWTPDVYEGAPTPITGFMAVATKAAAFGAFVRLFDIALGPLAAEWSDALAVLAAISIVVGNVGAIGQDSLKRLLGYSGIAQAGYMLVGLVVFSEVGANALVFYLAVYALMNLAAFAVVIARERETPHGDGIEAMRGLGAERPLLAWPMTIAMLGLAGLPGTAGFIGKIYLFEATVDGEFTWLALAIALGTMISLAYYLRVVAAIWMPATPEPAAMPAIAGAAPANKQLEVAIPAALAAAATVFFGVIPAPLVDWASQAGSALAAML